MVGWKAVEKRVNFLGRMLLQRRMRRMGNRVMEDETEKRDEPHKSATRISHAAIPLDFHPDGQRALQNLAARS